MKKLIWDKWSGQFKEKSSQKYSNQIALGGVMTMTAGIIFIILVIYTLQSKNQWILVGLFLGGVVLAFLGRIISKHFEDKRYEDKQRKRKNR